MLDTPEQIIEWLRSEKAKVAMHSWVGNFKRAAYISRTDLMTDAVWALAAIIEAERIQPGLWPNGMEPI